MADKTQKPAVELPEFLQRDSIINFDKTSAMVGLSKVHLRRLIKAKAFPKPVIIGYRKFGWQAGTILDHIAAKASQRAAA